MLEEEKNKIKNIINYYSPNKFYFATYKMFLKFAGFKVEKQEFYKSKKVIDLTLVDTNIIVVPDRFQLEEREKCYIGYKDSTFVGPLCIDLP